jgi:hypothetical protein
MRIAALGLLLIASSCSANDAAPGCGAIKPESRAVLSAWVAGVYGGGGQIDDEGTEGQRKQIVGYGRAILPCLVTLYREGPAAAGLWNNKKPSPSNARWALSLIKDIDTDTAISLLYEWRAEPGTDNPTRWDIDNTLGRLGNEAALGRLAVFLDSSATTTGGDPDRMRNIREEAVTVIALRNYRPALTGLKRLAVRPGNPPSNFWRVTVPIYIAQLSEDVPALTRYAHDDTCAITALEALKRMGRNDVLRSLAADMNYRFQGAAKTLLETAPAGAQAVKPPG